MAATVVLDGTKIATGDNISPETWGATRTRGTGGAPSAALATDVFIEGSDAIITRSTNSRVWLWFDIGSGNELDFTPSTGANAGEHVQIWFNMLAAGLLQLSTYTHSSGNGGIAIQIGSSTTNFNSWNLGGKDTYAGGWRNATIDPTKAASFTGGTGLSISSARYFGIVFDTSTAAKFDNSVVDAIVVGNGLRVYGTSTTDDTYGDILAADEGTIGNKYGYYRSDNEVIYCKGQTLLGDDVGTNAATLTSTNRTIVFEALEYKNSSGTWVTAVSSTFHSLKRVGNSTNGTALTLGDGTSIQSGLSPNGITPDITIDLDDTHTGTGADLTIIGARFSGISGLLALSTNVLFTMDNTIINNCIQVTGAGNATVGMVIRSSTFQNYAGESGALLWGDGANGADGMDVDGCIFQSNDGGTNSAGIEVTGTDTTYIFPNLTRPSASSNDFDVHNSSTTNKTISLTGTSNFSTKRENTGTITYSADKTIKFTVTTKDGTVIANARVGLYVLSTDVVVLNALTNGSGIATTTRNYGGDEPMYWRVREVNFAGDDYLAESGLITFESTGITRVVELSVDSNLNI